MACLWLYVIEMVMVELKLSIISRIAKLVRFAFFVSVSNKIEDGNGRLMWELF